MNLCFVSIWSSGERSFAQLQSHDASGTLAIDIFVFMIFFM